MKIAIVGTGVAGLAAARALYPRHALTVFEQRDRIGGHSHTVAVGEGAGTQPVDSGFIVYNERNYPHFTRWLADLDVATRPSDMSLSVSLGGGRLEYAGDNLFTLFGQRRNLLRPGHYRMLRHILHFNRRLKRLLAAGAVPDTSLGDFLAREGYGAEMREHYLIPMAAAIWSCPSATMLDFPLITFARFFDNHGLLDLADRPSWRTVSGGSRCYVDKLTAPFRDSIRLATPVVRAHRRSDGVRLTDARGTTYTFDQVIFAAHADQTLGILADADGHERRLLGAFPYQPNRAVVHTDSRLMPRRRRVWASWNYLAEHSGLSTQKVSVTYWMNRLQNIAGPVQYFVSLNPLQKPRAGTVVCEMDYDHPVFSARAIRAQAELDTIQGKRRTWFCGAWCGYGFHEDGLVSGLCAAHGIDTGLPREFGYVA